MGKSSLILVMGMSVIVAFFILKLNANSKENLSTTVNMFEQTQARLIANSGVEIYLEKLYADYSLINKTSPTHKLFNGEYFVKLEGTLPNVRVTATADFQGIKHISVADAVLEPVKFPNLPGGMYIATSAIDGAKAIGNMNVNGENHDANGVELNDGTGVLGISVDTNEQLALINDEIKKDPSKVQGLLPDGTFGDGSTGLSDPKNREDWAKIYQWLSNAADVTYLDGDKIPGTLGNLSAPQITLINNTDPKKEIQINANTTGAGILVVNGNVRFAGGFNYKGIVLCYKETAFDVTSVGTNEVIGGIIIAGKSVDYKGGGTMDVKYSSEVLSLIQMNLKSNGFTILRWYE